MERIHYQVQGWERFPEHLLDLVFEKLESTIDCLQFGAVCIEWHSIFKDNQMKKIEELRHGKTPMLLVPDEEPSWSIYNVMDNKFLATKLSLPYVKCHSGSSHGWLLVVAEDWSVTLYQPFSMVKEGDDQDFNIIHLPRLYLAHNERLEYYDSYDVLKVLITSDPLANPDEYNVILIMQNEGFVTIRPAIDSTWRTISFVVEIDFNMPVNIIYYKSKLYAIDGRGALVSANLADPSNPNLELVAPHLQQVPQVISTGHVIRRYLVESNDGNLWHVERHIEYHMDNNFRMTRWFRIFRLDFDTKRWVQLKSIGNRALFLGYDSSICVNALEFVGCQPNCIYFTYDLYYDGLLGRNPDVSCQDVGLYHVENEKFEYHFGLDATILSKMTDRRPPMWVVPTFAPYH